MAYTDCVTWDVEYTDQFEAWWDGLSDYDQDQIGAAVSALENRGPVQGRPLVDTVTSSRYGNMKELRPRGGNLRILFAFDPRRTAILLIGGDKTNDWRGFYASMIPIADQLYAEHLDTLRREGML